MIANARMYAVAPLAAVLWRHLLGTIGERSGLRITVIDHAPPAPIHDLWERPDMAAVFMCGLPYSLSDPRPALVAAPVLALPEGGQQPHYWSEVVVRANSEFLSLEDTFCHRLALTTRESQSGCFALLHELRSFGGQRPLFQEVIAPQITPRGALTAVLEGRADVAPIDSYAYRLLEKFEPDLVAQTRVVARTSPTPVPPLVSSCHTGLEPLQEAFLDSEKNADTAATMRALLLERFVRPDPAAYDLLRSRHQEALTFWREHRLAATVHPTFVF
jgi:ABC-type phosphate/phosphonate transport system substrate-binding protein